MTRLALVLATSVVVATGSVVVLVKGPLATTAIGSAHASPARSLVLNGQGVGCTRATCGTRSCVYSGTDYRPGARLFVYDRAARVWDVSTCNGFNAHWVKVYTVLSPTNPRAQTPLGSNAG